uniref:Uncharacterized protein n=1 Tax=Cyprinodon variegatus TaxID=28743 RepID=A0A3Q2EH68_CYPVA
MQTGNVSLFRRNSHFSCYHKKVFLLRGVVGGLLGWKNSKSFRPLHKILGDLSWKQKKKLFVRIMKNVLRSLTWKNKEHLVTIVKASTMLVEMVLCILVSFITVEFGYKVYYVEKVEYTVPVVF